MIGWLSWLVTYMVHVAAWSGWAALLVRRKNLETSAYPSIWKLALWGPVVTSLIAVALASRTETAWGEMALGAFAVPRLELSGRWAAPLHNSAFNTMIGRAVQALALGTLVAAGAGLVRFVGAALRLQIAIGTRTVVNDVRSVERLQRMIARSRVRRVTLTESPQVESPLVIGAGEICVPAGLLDALDDDEIDAVFAHELAHLERGDGIWFFLAGLVAAVLWLQPLNRWLASRFRQSAELACDDRAVQLTADPEGLARALTLVASSAMLTRRGLPVPTMARSSSSLVPRLERLLGVAGASSRGASVRGRTLSLAIPLALGLATAQLQIQVAEATAQLPPTPATPNAPPRGSQPDAAAASEHVAQLARREQALAAELESALRVPGAERAESPAGVRVIELRQEIDHAQAMRTWSEQRFIDEWTAWQAQSTAQPAFQRTSQATIEPIEKVETD